MDGILLRRIQEVTALQLYGGLNRELKTTARGSIITLSAEEIRKQMIGLQSSNLSGACFSSFSRTY